MENIEDRKWHVMYVHARHEKKIHSEIHEMGLESFMPMRKELHSWSDRKKWVEVPLFSSYVFANITSGERSFVHALNGFVKFVSSNGKPSIVPQWQIDGIRKFVDFCPENVSVLDCDPVGIEGTIVGGPLMGMRGKIVELRNEKFFTIKVDGIEKVLSITMPLSMFRAEPSTRELQIQPPLLGTLAGRARAMSVSDGERALKGHPSPQ